MVVCRDRGGGWSVGTDVGGNHQRYHSEGMKDGGCEVPGVSSTNDKNNTYK